MNKLIIIPALLALGTVHAEVKTWTGEGELGYNTSKTESSTESSSLIARLGLNYKKNAWGNQLRVENILTEATDSAGTNSKSADRSTLTDKLTYDINETVYGFANARYEDDTFSAYHYQKNLILGLGWHSIKNDITQLDFELGAGGRQDKLRSTITTVGIKQSGAAIRFFEDLSHKLTDTTALTQSLLIEGNSDNTQSILEAGLQVAVNAALALKLRHQVKHNSEVPVGTSNYSRISTVTLVYGF